MLLSPTFVMSTAVYQISKWDDFRWRNWPGQGRVIAAAVFQPVDLTSI
jgi:hypothetical protein